ncbi:phage tail protein [Colwelliaceae bacterium 6471]
MSEPFIAEVRMWGCNFAPRGWAFCDGQILPISQNTTLFSLIGTIYGGDGRTTMALPNLTDRTPLHSGRGPGLSYRPIGQPGGQTEVSLSELEIPAHDHIVRGVSESAISATPSEILFMGHDQSSRQENTFYLSTETQTNTTLAPQAIGNSGGSQPHENQQPYLGVNFCIAMQGLYPSRS